MLYDLVRWEEKAIYQAAQRKGIDLKLINCRRLHFDLSKDHLEEIGDITLQRCISYFRGLHLAGLLESKGIDVVNDFHSTLIAGNKLFTTLALIKAQLPVPRTMLSFTPEASLDALDELGYPAILKPTVGSWGRLVSLLNDRDSAVSVFEHREQMFPLYRVYYLQEKVNRPPRDIRSFVIGDKVVAAIYRISQSSDFRTNTARGGKAENCTIDKELEDISLKAARAIGDGIYGVDIMESPEGLVVHEVNNTIEFKNTVPATGVDIQGLIIEHLLQRSK